MHAKLEILGRVGRDPEQRFGRDGGSFATLSVVVNRKYKGRNGELQEVVEWYDVLVSGKQGENVVKYVNKGDMIYLEGSVSARQYTTKDGEARASLSVRAYTIEFVAGSRNGGGGSGGKSNSGRREAPGKGSAQKRSPRSQANLEFDGDDDEGGDLPF